MGDKWVDPLEQFLKYHKYVSEYVADLEKVSNFVHRPGTWKGREFDDFLKKYFYDHFSFEEQKIFPLLIKNTADARLKQTVQELYKEHEDMLEKVSRLRKHLRENDLDKDIYNLAKGVLMQLLEHGAKEDDELLPVIEKNRHLFS